MPTIQLNGLSEIWPLGINNRQESSIKMGRLLIMLQKRGLTNEEPLICHDYKSSEMQDNSHLPKGTPYNTK